MRLTAGESWLVLTSVMQKTVEHSASAVYRAFGSSANTRLAQAIIASLLLMISLVAIASAAPAPFQDGDGQILTPLTSPADWSD